MLREFYSLLDFHRSIRFSEGASARSEADFGFGKVAAFRTKATIFSRWGQLFTQFPVDLDIKLRCCKKTASVKEVF